jgi:hypothetical protein
MTDGDDHLKRVLGPIAVDGLGKARLELDEGLTAGEPPTRRVPLHGSPFGQLGETRQLAACPLAEVALEEASVGDD